MRCGSCGMALKAVKRALSPHRLGMTPIRKKVESFYASGPWRALVAQIKRERGAFCERCGSAERVIADHIVERKDGGADLDPRNVELLCAAHHNAKTAATRARRATRSPGQRGTS